ncbi:hypothetical protein PFAG_03739 [Plasmodium falciparum Santa Lucia]|uniref:Uncharacterized protein n=2 Tax=Plasmodium falciparum TaxID=5833 RepID=A0A024X4G2_PLAFC|nr:hypothetical protein PFMC_03677 [Plasmodium falciparum CAMP/Malaysia]EUT82991.1 hypothetical protein PFAG_03739 [Plasmodium falciparum Santa Lucia]
MNDFFIPLKKGIIISIRTIFGRYNSNFILKKKKIIRKIINKELNVFGIYKNIYNN